VVPSKRQTLRSPSLAMGTHATATTATAIAKSSHTSCAHYAREAIGCWPSRPWQRRDSCCNRHWGGRPGREGEAFRRSIRSNSGRLSWCLHGLSARRRIGRLELSVSYTRREASSDCVPEFSYLCCDVDEYKPSSLFSE
jgi:hypothetical protein